MTSTTPPRPRSESSRERLIEATRELLYEKGFSSTSPADIRARADVGHGSMYHHFPTKVDVAAAAVRRNSDELRQAMDEHLTRAPSPALGARSYLSKPRDGIKGCRFGRLTMDDAVLEDDRLRVPVADALTWYRRRVEGLLRDGQATGELRDDVSAEDVAAAVVAIVQGAHVLARADRSQESFDRAIRGGLTMLSALERGEGGHASAPDGAPGGALGGGSGGGPGVGDSSEATGERPW